MSNPGGPPARTGRILADWGPRDIPRTRPPKRVPIDLEALAEFNEGVERARAAYYDDKPQGRASLATRRERHQARKDESS